MSCEKCKELINYLSEYVDESLSKELCSCIEVHMKECESCKQMVEDFVSTVNVARNLDKVKCPKVLQESIYKNFEKLFNK